jgi:hypothetical protein
MIFTMLSFGTVWNAPAQSVDLSGFQWKNRLLFLFAPDRSHPMLDELHRSLAAQNAEVIDRDMVIFEILESAPSRVNDDYIEAEAAQSLRKKFSVQQGTFEVILIGKDGGVKLRSQDQVNLSDIFSLIDAMPMRREEVRKKRN